MSETTYQKIDRLQAERDSARRELERVKTERDNAVRQLAEVEKENDEIRGLLSLAPPLKAAMHSELEQLKKDKESCINSLREALKSPTTGSYEGKIKEVLRTLER